jgi:Fe-S-cluster containining protein
MPRPTARVELRVLDQPVVAEVPAPTGRVSLDAALPLLRQLDDQVVALAAEREPLVSCRKGCSACCRGQPIHVAPQEALALARLVDALPEPRRTQVRERFAATEAVLRDAGLLDLYLTRVRPPDGPAALEVWRRYHGLRLACPFLDDDACGIHPERPFICRQHLVTTPAAWCDDPFDPSIRSVPTLVKFLDAALQTCDDLIGGPWVSVPLSLSLAFAAKYRAELERTFPAEDVFRAAVGTALRQ